MQYDAPHRATAQEVLHLPFFISDIDRVLDNDVLEKFESFARRGQLQQALLPLMNKHYAEKGNFLDEYTRKLAKDLDSDGNGILDFEAFNHCLVNIGAVVTEKEARKVFEGLDADKSGTLEIKEIQQWFKYDYIMSQDEVKLYFNLNC